MPNIITNSNKTQEKPKISAYRQEILYREDIKTAFGYSLVGIAAVLGLTGMIYVVGKKLTA
jgi:hypothetical protein